MSDTEHDAEENGFLDAKALNEMGMPDMTEEEREEGGSKSMKMLLGIMIGPRLICLAIAYAIYRLGSTDSYDKKIAILSSLELGWLYIGAYSLAKTIVWLNVFPMFYKGQIMRGNSGNLRANMFIYKVNFPNQEENGHEEGSGLPYVVMEDKDEIGEYNRANRSLGHYTESAAAGVIAFLLAGFVFPFPVMILMIIFCFGRIAHQIGYAGGYGGHGAGFGLAVVTQTTAEMMVILVALGSLGVPLK